MRRPGRKVVGLDLQAGSVAAAEVSPNGGSIGKAIVDAIPEGLFHEGEVVDAEGLGRELRRVFKRARLGRRVRMGIASPRVVTRVLTIPAGPEGKELDAAVRFQATEALPMRITDAVMDYRVLEADPANAGTQRVMIVAVPREMADGYVAATRRAGLRLEGIDLSAFALVRALAPWSRQPVATAPGDGGDGSESAAGSGGVSAFCHIGTVTNIAVARDATCFFVRAVPFGVDAIAHDLAARHGMADADARRWIEYVGLDADLSGVEVDPGLVRDVREILWQGVDRLAREIQASLDYYASLSGFPQVDRMILSGPATGITGLAAELGRRFAKPCAAAVPPIDFGGHASREQLTVAVGLGLEEALN